MRKTLALPLCLFLLVGCSAARSIMVADDSAVISAFGRGPGDREIVVQNLLAEAAKTTRVHGYQYFIILKAQDTTRIGTMSVPDQMGARTAANNLSKPGANYAQFSRNVSYLRPGMDITIRMFRKGEIDPAIMGVWNIDGTMGPALDKAPNPKERPRQPSNLRG